MAQLPEQYDIVVNIQGDEPLLEPHIIDDVVAALQAAPDAVYRCRSSCCPGIGRCKWNDRRPESRLALTRTNLCTPCLLARQRYAISGSADIVSKHE